MAHSIRCAYSSSTTTTRSRTTSSTSSRNWAPRARRADGLVVSPGPGLPSDAGNSIELARELGVTTPTLGVCLGHQAIVEGFGGRIAQARSLIHGKASTISHDGRGIYAGLPSRIDVGRYHSLAAMEIPKA